MVENCVEIVGRCSTHTVSLLQTKHKKTNPWEISSRLMATYYVTCCVKALGRLMKKKERNEDQQF